MIFDFFFFYIIFGVLDSFCSRFSNCIEVSVSVCSYFMHKFQHYNSPLWPSIDWLHSRLHSQSSGHRAIVYFPPHFFYISDLRFLYICSEFGVRWSICFSLCFCFTTVPSSEVSATLIESIKWTVPIDKNIRKIKRNSQRHRISNWCLSKMTWTKRRRTTKK